MNSVGDDFTDIEIVLPNDKVKRMSQPSVRAFLNYVESGKYKRRSMLITLNNAGISMKINGKDTSIKYQFKIIDLSIVIEKLKAFNLDSNFVIALHHIFKNDTVKNIQQIMNNVVVSK